MLEGPQTVPSEPQTSQAARAKNKSKRKPKGGGPATAEEIVTTMEAAVAVLHRLGHTLCLFGSAGCAMYGMDHRIPHDVDVIVLGAAHDCEHIKLSIPRLDNRFFLVPARNPQNHWNVLWFRPMKKRQVKVDVLSPGTIGIPAIPPFAIQYPYGRMPLAPFLCLLLLKLQGYFDHLEHTEKRMRDKIPDDIRDMESMVRLGVIYHGAHINQLNSGWYTPEFIETALYRAKEFVKVSPVSAQYWRRMGFNVQDPLDSGLM
ncbi:hypothetical protein CYLTODRAFT_418574 [Cylindrobasidium torrendii FP15055 ss-10]|uniref:Uncharacterized protein n=1 Tax=Cylindrobasidium torrendii FP15055 ss-10 TaxID=1314674 RepID=A0A0D7BQ04_9AGAR|nr:hypothetical protein CYLTODRAFT_418574 [Cylindrobasidium torrendii FP15055 ss-10]